MRLFWSKWIAAGNLRGDLLMASGHLSWAIYTLAAKPLLQRHDPLRIAMVATLLSPLPLLPLAVAEPWDPARMAPALGWIALLAFLATTVGTVAWNRALRDVSAGTMAPLRSSVTLDGVPMPQTLGDSQGQPECHISRR